MKANSLAFYRKLNMTTDHIIDSKENKEFAKASDNQIHDDELITLEGENSERSGKLKFTEREEAKLPEAEERVPLRPVVYKYIEQITKEGVSEEPAVQALVGRLGGNSIRQRRSDVNKFRAAS